LTVAPIYLLAVLCAGWCSACERFRPDFHGAALDGVAQHRLWIDIEDHAAALPPELDIATLPMLLVARTAHHAAFFGPIRPDVNVVLHLARAAGVEPRADMLLAHVIRGWTQPS
jgi:hypothetical protein